MSRAVPLIICAIFAVTNWGCAKRELRGKTVRSADGKTYLVIEHDNGEGCGSIRVDGAEWRHALHSAGEVEPGLHRISCGDSDAIEFTIEPGATFHFDYWGP
jgi:hypothetical protein